MESTVLAAVMSKQFLVNDRVRTVMGQGFSGMATHGLRQSVVLLLPEELMSGRLLS